MEQLHLLLLLEMDMNKLFKIYWKKENQMLIIQDWFIFIFLHFSSILFSLYFFLFFFSVSHFSIFDNMKKDGATPLYIAAQNGYEQIVQILLEKGKPNVDLVGEVLFLFDFWLSVILVFSFSFFFPFSFFFFFLFLFLFLFLFFFFFFFFFLFSILINNERVGQLLFILLLKKDTNKLFKFC